VLPPGFGANLLRRLATAAVALPALLLALFRGSSELVVGIVAAALLVALYEFYRLMQARALAPMRVTGLLLAAAMFADVAIPAFHGTPFWPVAALAVLVAALARGRDLAQTLPSAALTLLGAVYLGALGGTIAALRTAPTESEGAWRIVLLLATIMGSDTLAFFVGHALGRRALAPSVSPGKTIEGALGGIVGGIAGALSVRALGLPSVPLVDMTVLGALVAALGILGDLDESLLKRWAGVKDSGALFPGHGGMLDRLDSLLFGAPALYYYFLYVR
jgi:phosphatidate cytidylyltransferase